MWCNANHHNDSVSLHSDYPVNDGTKSIFYVTDAIAPLAVEANAKVKLTGFPLEMTVQTEQGEMIMKATKVSKEVSAEVFKVGDGFTKVTMEEFQKQMELS